CLMCLCVAPPDSAGRPDSSLFGVSAAAFFASRDLPSRTVGSQTIPDVAKYQPDLPRWQQNTISRVDALHRLCGYVRLFHSSLESGIRKAIWAKNFERWGGSRDVGSRLLIPLANLLGPGPAGRAPMSQRAVKHPPRIDLACV